MILAQTFNVGHRSNHMVVKLNFIHEQILNGTIALKWIDTKGMVADMLTKALPL